jgi:hypothetical protein
MKKITLTIISSAVATFGMAGDEAIAQKLKCLKGTIGSIDGSSCCMLDGNGNVAGVSGQLVNFVQTPSGNAMLTCKNDFSDPLTPTSGKAAHFDGSTGLKCVLPDGSFTGDWQEVVSTSGQATLKCSEKKP